MKQVLCFGDSNTWGLNPRNNQRFPWGVRWTSILQEELGAEEYHIIEEGLCGRTTIFDDVFRKYRNGSSVLPMLLEVNSGFDYIVLMLGTNDCKSYFKASSAVIGKGVETLLEQIREHSPNAKVILASPIELGSDVWKEDFDPEFDVVSVDTSKELKTVYKHIAEKWNTAFIAASDWAKPSKYDMEHMDENGHLHFANAVKDVILSA